MQNTTSVGAPELTEEAEAEVERLQGEMRVLRAQMQRDQDEIAYLKAKTAATMAETRGILAQLQAR